MGEVPSTREQDGLSIWIGGGHAEVQDDDDDRAFNLNLKLGLTKTPGRVNLAVGLTGA